MRYCFLFFCTWGLLVCSSPYACAAACGGANQTVCTKEQPDCGYADASDKFLFCVFGDVRYCDAKDPSLQLSDQKTTCIPGPIGAGVDCCQKVNYVDGYSGQTDVTDGYYARIDLNRATVVIPDPDYPDWCNPSGSIHTTMLS